MNRNNNNNRQNNRPKNLNMDVVLFELSRTAKRDYDRDSLLELLEEIPFNKISIPVYANKNLVYNKDAKGIIPVGYVRGYDPESEVFTVSIYGNYAETVKGFAEPVIYVNPFLNDQNEVTTVLNLIIGPVELWGDLYND